MRQSRDEIVSKLLKDAIENDFTDIVKVAITLEGFESNPKDNPRHIAEAAYNLSENTLRLLVDLDFAVMHKDVIEGVSRAIVGFDDNIEILTKVLAKIGTDSVTSMVASMLSEEVESQRYSAKTPFSQMSFADADYDTAIKKISTLTDFIDFKQLTQRQIVQVFANERTFDSPHCTYLLSLLNEQGLLSDLDTECHTLLFSYLAKSNNTQAVNFCLKNNILFANKIENISGKNTLSFFLVSELYADGMDINMLFNEDAVNTFSEYYFKRFFEDIASSEDFSTCHPSLALCCEIASGKIAIDHTDAHDKVADNIINGLFKFRIYNSKGIDLVIFAIENIISQLIELGNKNAVSAIHDKILDFTPRLNGNELEQFSNFLLNNESYLSFAEDINSMLSEASNSYFYGNRILALYLIKTKQHESLPLTKKMLEKVPPNQKVITALLSAYLETNTEKHLFEVAVSLVELLHPQTSEDVRKEVFNKLYWTIPDKYSLTKEFAAMEKSSNNDTKFPRLLAIAFAPERYFIKFLNSTNQTNTRQRVHLATRVRNVDIAELLMSNETSQKTKILLSELISGL